MRRLTASIAALLLAMAILTMAGCGSGDEASDTTRSTLPTPPVEGTTWLLTSYARGGEVATPVLPDANVSMVLQDGKVSGSGGCNDYFGSYTLDGENLTISVEGSTQKACEPEVMLQEQLFIEALADGTTWAMEGVELRLLSDTGAVVATFTEARSLPLTGTTWSLTDYLVAEKQAFTSVIAETQVTAIFADDGTVGGSAGCNEYSGPYTAEGDTLSISALTSTQKECPTPEGIMDQEVAYLADLQKAATFTAQGATLTIFDASGTKLLQYEATAMAE